MISSVNLRLSNGFLNSASLFPHGAEAALLLPGHGDDSLLVPRKSAAIDNAGLDAPVMTPSVQTCSTGSV